MRKNILIAVGGTGGHLFPAQALARQIRSREENVNIMFVGEGLLKNPYFCRDEFSFREVPSGTFSKRKIFQSIINCGVLAKGFVSSFGIIKSFRPDVIVGFGSYHSLPPLAAAKAYAIPIVLHEGNSIPGKVNRFFSRFARITTVSFPMASNFLSGKSLYVNFPLRDGYTPLYTPKEKARRHFVLQANKFTFLVFGGSQGALALNTHFCAAVLDLIDRSRNFQVIHLTGHESFKDEIKEFYRDNGVEACVRSFEERMDLAWIAADLAITRSGASSIAESIAMETPTILVPYPFATNFHQDKNADYVQNEVRGAVKLEEKDLKPTKLAQTISGLLENDREKLSMMKQSLCDYKSNSGAHDLCSIVFEVAGIKVR